MRTESADKSLLPIAIHDAPDSFSSGWIEYCEKYGIPYLRVNCYDDDIIDTLKRTRALMWHWHHADPAAPAFARQLTLSLEGIGIPVFPDSRTSWHFDDKVGQKYLFESLEIPHVPSFVFYHPAQARKFVKSHGLPLVFKLTGGAGSMNVKLITTSSAARRVIARSFGRGWSSRSRTYALRERIWQFRRDRSKESVIGLGRGLMRFFVPNKATRSSGVESGYVYFQEFIPNNDSDIRVIVIGEKAFGIRRLVRDGDFRASGSGTIDYEPASIPPECVRLAFDAAKKMRTQVAAFDFVLRGRDPLIVEVSYGFNASAYADCLGYWDTELEWHPTEIKPESLMMEVFIHELENMAK